MSACVWRAINQFPDLARLHALNPGRYPHLLESVAQGSPEARFDILFAFPGKALTLEGSTRLVLDGSPIDGQFLEVFDQQWRNDACDAPRGAPFPFHGGWFVYLGYELARSIEPVLAATPTETDWPIAFAVRVPAAIIRDHVLHETWLVCEEQHSGMLAKMEQDLNAAAANKLDDSLPALSEISEEDPAIHLYRIERVLEYIRAGDTFQVNLSRTWQAWFDAPPSTQALYARLRAANPAPFAGLMTMAAGRALISSSPERLVCVRQGQISTRPIAGTFPRAVEHGQDQQLRRALVQHPKERAEHVMLVDLERNDLGRICHSGSVRASELLKVETYRHVHHIVSNITGRLRDDVTPGDVIRAVFPGGTITGCPKLRTMQIIAELERAPRGAYTGSMGYINRDGSMDLNILIRSMTVDGSRIQLRAGGGIVADSDPERELHETRVKARGVLSALGAVGTST
jgi:anthranilate synthase component 1